MGEDLITAAIWTRPSAPSTEPKANEKPRANEADRRSDRRARALLKGKIIVGDGKMSADCIIHDLSPDGAHVRIDRSVPLPPSVGLLVIKDGALFDAVVAWRKDDRVGLALGDRHDVRRAGDPAMAHLHALWAALAPR